MPFYDFFCKECFGDHSVDPYVEKFLKMDEEKIAECENCGNQMTLSMTTYKTVGLRDPGGIGQKWTNDGYNMRDPKSDNLRTVKKKYVKGKRVI